MASTLQTSYLKVQICFLQKVNRWSCQHWFVGQGIYCMQISLEEEDLFEDQSSSFRTNSEEAPPTMQNLEHIDFWVKPPSGFWKDLNGYKGSGFYFETQVLIASWQQSNQGTSKFTLRSKGQCLVGKKSTFSCLCSCLPPPWGVKIASGALLKSFGRFGVGLDNWALRKQGVSEKQRWICFDTEECRLYRHCQNIFRFIIP